MIVNRRVLVGGIIGAGVSGGLGAPRHDQHYEPPEGGQVIPGARSVVRAQKVIIIGKGPPAAGLFVYSPTIAAGNLIDSIAAQSGTDGPPGNAVIQGIANYVNAGVVYQAIVMQNGQLVLYQAPTEAGPWTVQSVINQASGAMNVEAITGDLVLAAPTFQIVFQSPYFGNAAGNEISAVGTSTTPLLLLDNTASNLGSSESLAFIAANVGDTVAGITVPGDTFQRFALVANGEMTWGPGNAAPLTSLTPAAGAGLTLLINRNNTNAITIQNLGTNGGQPLVQLITSVAADRALGLEAAADTGERIRFDTVPQMLMGPGNTTPDCTFSRAGPQEFYSDGIAARVGGAPEVWNAVGGTGNATFANGWTNAAQGPNLQYRKVAAPYNCIQWVGRIVAPAGVVVGQAITGSPSATYKPTDIGDILAWDTTSSQIVLLRIGTGGALSYQGGGVIGNGDVITIPAGNGLVSLDA